MTKKAFGILVWRFFFKVIRTPESHCAAEKDPSKRKTRHLVFTHLLSDLPQVFVVTNIHLFGYKETAIHEADETDYSF